MLHFRVAIATKNVTTYADEINDEYLDLLFVGIHLHHVITHTHEV